MTVVRHDFPILEYDTESQAVIMPDQFGQRDFPAKAVLAFLGDEVDRYAADHDCALLDQFATITKPFPVWRTVHRDQEVGLVQAPLGASAAVQLLEYLIGHGATQIIAVGSCGALIDFAENEWLVPVAALRDEGTSYHYLPPARTIGLNPEAIAAVAAALDGRSLPYERCLTWTTDGFFRETAALVEYRKAEGCTVVDMECAALAACAQFRGVTFGQLLYTADSLADVEAHDQRDWGAASTPLGLRLALDAVCAL